VSTELSQNRPLPLGILEASAEPHVHVCRYAKAPLAGDGVTANQQELDLMSGEPS